MFVLIYFTRFRLKVRFGTIFRLFMTRYLPILPINLDPRTEFSLANEAKLRVVQASNYQITDISSGSVVSALMEGFAFSQAELLYYLNQMPEAYTATFLSQVMGIQLKSSEPSTAVIEFVRNSTVSDSPYLLSSGYSLQSSSGVIFETLSPVNFNPGEAIKYVIAQSVSYGSSTNVPANSITRSVNSNTQFSSINNPSPAYGGTDGESYSEAKARAFSQLRRRNPVSVADFEDLVKDLLGTSIKVKAIERAANSVVQVASGVYMQPEADATVLLEKLLAKKKSINSEYFITPEDVKIVTKQLARAKVEGEHLTIVVQTELGELIDPEILNKVTDILQSKAPMGVKIHVQNAHTQLLNIDVTLDDNDLTVTSEVEDYLQSYINSLGLGSRLDYSLILSAASKAANINSLQITTGRVIENYGLPTENVINNVVVSINKQGVTVYNPGVLSDDRPVGNLRTSDSYPGYGESVIWKLESVNVFKISDRISYPEAEDDLDY